MGWYVIHVHVMSEQTVCDKIHARVPSTLWEDCFVPQVENVYKKAGQCKTVVRPLFPGYVFIVCEDPQKIMPYMKEIQEYTRILKTGDEFESLSKNEVDYLTALAGERQRVELSKGYIVGDQVFIVEGPMKGMDGNIRKIDRHKRIALVEVPFLGRPTQVRLPLEIVSKQ